MVIGKCTSEKTNFSDRCSRPCLLPRALDTPFLLDLSSFCSNVMMKSNSAAMPTFQICVASLFSSSDMFVSPQLWHNGRAPPHDEDAIGLSP